jgi:hypothetical protein
MHICTRHAQTILAPIALKIHQQAHLMTFFSDMPIQVLFCSETNGVYFMYISWTSSNMPNFTHHELQRHSGVHRLCHIVLNDENHS